MTIPVFSCLVDWQKFSFMTSNYPEQTCKYSMNSFVENSMSSSYNYMLHIQTNMQIFYPLIKLVGRNVAKSGFGFTMQTWWDEVIMYSEKLRRKIVKTWYMYIEMYFLLSTAPPYLWVNLTCDTIYSQILLIQERIWPS